MKKIETHQRQRLLNAGGGRTNPYVKGSVELSQCPSIMGPPPIGLEGFLKIQNSGGDSTNL
jgi:hypothetical protein